MELWKAFILNTNSVEIRILAEALYMNYPQGGSQRLSLAAGAETDLRPEAAKGRPRGV